MFGWLKKLLTGSDDGLWTYPEKTASTATPEPLLGHVADIYGVNNTQKPKADLDKMTKAELETYAKENFDVDIDRRKKKADIVAQVKSLAK